MTEEEAKRRLFEHVTVTLDALAVLVDWPKLLEAGERAGKGPLAELRALRAVAEAAETLVAPLTILIETVPELSGRTLDAWGDADNANCELEEALAAWRALSEEVHGDG